MQRILILGSNADGALENIYSKYLNELKVITEILPIQVFFLKHYHNSIFNKILFRIGFRKIYKNLQYKILDKVDSFKPDLVWVFKGMEVTPKTLKKIKSKGIYLINYNPDNPFIFTGYGSGNSNITNSISLFDLHLTYDRDIQTQIRDLYNLPCELLPFGFDFTLEQIQKEIVETNEVCFLGNPDKQRANFIKQLLDKGIIIHAYGNNWNKFIKHPLLKSFPSVYGSDFCEVLKKYRIQLNLMRIHNLDSHNMRSFEVPGIGGIMLAPKTKDHVLFFEDNKEIFLYKNIDECVEKINYLLSLPTEQAKEFRTFARQAAIDKKHSYKDRAFQVFNALKALQ